MIDDPAALVRFDGRVFRSEFAQTFARWSDRAWLAFGLAVTGIALGSMRTIVLPFDARLATAALSAMWGAFVASGSRARLTVHAEEGAPAVFALDPVSRHTHQALATGTALALLLLLVGLARPATVGVRQSPLRWARWSAGSRRSRRSPSAHPSCREPHEGGESWPDADGLVEPPRWSSFSPAGSWRRTSTGACWRRSRPAWR